MTTINQASMWSELKALPNAYWVLFTGTLINRFGHFVMPFLALYLGQRDYAGWVAGVALGAYGLAGLIANLLGGYFTDRYGRKPTIMAACLGGAASMLAMSAANGPWAIIICSFSVGLTGAMYYPAANALLADLVKKELRIRAFACQRLASNLGFAIGMASAGLLAEYSFQLLFYIDAATTLTLCGLVFFGIQRIGFTKVAQDQAGWKPALVAARNNSAFVRCLIANFCVAMVFFQITTSWALFVIDSGFCKQTFGYLTALNGIIVALFELPLTSITRRYRPVTVMAVGYALVGIGMGMNLLGGDHSYSLAIFILVTIIFTLGEMISLPISNSYIAELAPEEMRGRFMGLLGVSWSTSLMLGPALGMSLYKVSPNSLWILCIALGLAAAIAVKPRDDTG